MKSFDTNRITKILASGSGNTKHTSGSPAYVKRVLVIEGDGFIRMRLIGCLVAAGFDVKFAPNGRLGLAKLRVYNPDILILELSLHGTSGLKLIRQARRDASFGDRPIYVFTSADSIKRSIRKELAETGAKVFDKSSIAEEQLVMNIAAELLGMNLAVGRSAPAPETSDAVTQSLFEANSGKTGVPVSLPAVPGDAGNSISDIRAIPNPPTTEFMDTLTKAFNPLHEQPRLDAPAAGAVSGPDPASHQLCGTVSLHSSRGVFPPDVVQGRLVTPSTSQPETPRGNLNDGQPSEPLQANTEGRQSGCKKRKPTILFVEDDPVLLKVYKRALTDQGFRVVTAEDGLLAIENLSKVRPDLVLLDLMLPKLHGFEVLKLIRADAEFKDVPVVVLSNAFMEGLAARALDAGANKGMSKSQCTPSKLVEVISELLGAAPNRSNAQEGTGQFESDTAFVTNAESQETCIWVRQKNTLRDAPEEISRIRESCRAYAKAFGAGGSSTHLDALYRRVRFFYTQTVMSGFTKLDCVAGALEALLFDVTYKKIEPTPLILRTITQAVDCLAYFVESGDTSFSDPMRKRRVLVVDDDPVCALTTVAALKLARVEAVGTQKPCEGLRMLETGCFDLVILDVDMPEMNGFEVCNQLRRMPKYKTCPVIFATICNGIDSRARGVLVGASDYMMKPITPAELTLKVAILLAKSSPETDTVPQDAAATPTSAGLSQNGFHEAGNQPPAAKPTPRKVSNEAQAAELGKHGKELGKRLAELVAQVEERKQTEAGLREQLEVTGSAKECAQVRCDQLEQELAMLRQTREELTAKVGFEEAQAAELDKHGKELEKRLAELETQVEERKQTETGLREQLEVSGSAKECAQARCSQLEQELALLRQTREELSAKVGFEEAQAAELDKHGKELEKRLERTEIARRTELAEANGRIRQGVALLTRAISDLEAERAARERIEHQNVALRQRLQGMHEEAARNLQSDRNSRQRISALEGEVHKHTEICARLTVDLQRERTQGQLAAEQLAQRKELNRKQQLTIASLTDANEVLSSAHNNLQVMFENSLGKLHDAESSLQQESGERHRLMEALESAQHDAELRSEQSRAELARLQVGIQSEQVKRRRMETNLLRLRHVTIDSARAARAVRADFRLQIQQPVDDLFRTMRRLLSLETNAEHKVLAEAALQDALLVKEHLRESQPSDVAPPACEPTVFAAGDEGNVPANMNGRNGA